MTANPIRVAQLFNYFCDAIEKMDGNFQIELSPRGSGRLIKNGRTLFSFSSTEEGMRKMRGFQSGDIPFDNWLCEVLYLSDEFDKEYGPQAYSYVNKYSIIGGNYYKIGDAAIGINVPRHKFYTESESYREWYKRKYLSGRSNSITIEYQFNDLESFKRAKEKVLTTMRELGILNESAR